MLSQQLVQKQSQKLVITQDLRQSIELLQLSNIELSSRIQSELLENPLLEDTSENQTSPALADPPGPPEKTDSVQRTEKEEGDFSWTDSSDYRALSTPGDIEKTERKHQFIENGISSRESLADHLLWQLRLSMEETEIRIGEYIISAINEKGFLTEEISDLLDGTEFKSDQARTVLAQIQAFDPIGCGTRDVQETLYVYPEIGQPVVVNDHAHFTV